MKTTVDIPDQELADVLRLTGAKTQGEAIVLAVSEFNRRRRLEALARELGTFDQVISNQELSRLRESR